VNSIDQKYTYIFTTDSEKNWNFPRIFMDDIIYAHKSERM